MPVLREREVQLHYKHGLSHFWLDSGVPSHSPGLGAADLCMPFVAQVHCFPAAHSANVPMLLEEAAIYKHAVVHIASHCAHIESC